MRRSTFQWKERAFQWKRGEAIQCMGGLVRISTAKAIQLRGSGDSVNRRTLKSEKLLSSSASQKAALISEIPSVLLGIPWPALRGPLRNHFWKKRRPQPHWGREFWKCSGSLNALNYRAWGIPAVFSTGISGNALRAFPGSFRNFSGISSGKCQPYWPIIWGSLGTGFRSALWGALGTRHAPFSRSHFARHPQFEGA